MSGTQRQVKKPFKPLSSSEGRAPRLPSIRTSGFAGAADGGGSRGRVYILNELPFLAVLAQVCGCILKTAAFPPPQLPLAVSLDHSNVAYSHVASQGILWKMRLHRSQQVSLRGSLVSCGGPVRPQRRPFLRLCAGKLLLTRNTLVFSTQSPKWVVWACKETSRLGTGWLPAALWPRMG